MIILMINLVIWVNQPEKPIQVTIVFPDNYSGKKDLNTRSNKKAFHEYINRKRVNNLIEYADYIKRRGY